ncbi:hydroxyisourate hydrolase [Microlunatus spumicola]|uniref:5-hydroxyisourate hydrolase n=1 Tax=Microlunatus spumicola TaxID=81499 RepID=A0ABP6XK31_9ACTN
MSEGRSRVTTHVLDAVSGRPATDVAVLLERRGPDGWGPVAEGRTDGDGRIGRLGPDDLEAGTYRATFAVGDYFAAKGQDTFYPEVVIGFTLDDPAAHYHVPLLLSPYAYSTYRGS